MRQKAPAEAPARIPAEHTDICTDTQAEREKAMYHFIINPRSRSGKGKDIWFEIESELIRSNAAYKKYFTRYHLQAREIASLICAKYPEEKTIVVVGGDGTMNEVVNGLTLDGTVTLGYIPTGSSNDFARSMGIPFVPKTALQDILSAKETVEFHCGRVTTASESRIYVGSSGLGYDADVCRRNDWSEMKGVLNHVRLGKMSYSLIALQALTRWKGAEVTIRRDEEEKETYSDVLFLAPMNQPYEGGGMMMSPTADIRRPGFVICLVHGIAKAKMPRLLIATYKGAHTADPGVAELPCGKVEVEADRPLPLHVDGEYIGDYDKAVFSVCETPVRILV